MNSRHEMFAGCCADRRGSALNDAAFVHENDLVAEISRFGEIVSDEDRGLVQALENFLQVLLQRGADEGIKRAERFIEQQQFRRKHERAHQADALALAAGKLERVTIERVFGKSRQGAELRETVLHFRLGFPRCRAMSRMFLRAVR